ncbi:MAG: sulfotransferase [Acidimicrobiia bacterium]|nr:sulfotransferase [Acidimicrobiia bacterium]
MEPSKDPLPVFPTIVGSGRSGTTLLRSMLNAHPELSIPRESHFLVDLASTDGRLVANDDLDVPALVDRLGSNPWFQAWDLDLAEVEAQLGKTAPADLASAVRVVYSTYAHAHGKTRYGDKTPSYVMHMPTILGLLPEARFVHLIRDGRDVALSFLDASFGPDTVEEAALHWKQRVRRGRSAGRQLGPGRYLEVFYEDLVTRPEDALGAICAFLDLPYHPQMLRYRELLDDFIPTVDALPSHHENLAKAPRVTRSWQQEMSGHQVARFELLGGGELRRANYQLSGVRPTPADVYHAAGTYTAWQTRRFKKKLGAAS